MKIFGVGFHKTGTSSLHAWCAASGLTARHWPVAENGVNYERRCAAVADRPGEVVRCLAPIIDAYDAHFDVPYPGLYRELATAYPQAYFILTRRDLESWWASLVDHWALWALPRRLDPYEHIQYRPYLNGRRRLVRLADKHELMDAHACHIDAVERFFAGHPRFISFDIDNPQKSELLSGLTGLPLVTFENRNPRHTPSERLRQRWKRLIGRSRHSIVERSRYPSGEIGT